MKKFFSNIFQVIKKV